MDGELLEAPSGNEDESYTEIFEKHFPYYLAIGMTYDQYWCGGANLVKSYREAERLRNEKINSQMWLQGMYIYDALLRVSPILHAFAKNGTRAEPYVPEPYPIDGQSEKRTEASKEEARYNLNKARMEVMAVEWNKRFKERK